MEQTRTDDPMTRQSRSTSLKSKQNRLVFFLPGILGDEPKQAFFRRSLPGSIDFVVLELPDSPRHVVCSLPETGRVVAEKVMRLQDKGSIHIVGFSFGANLAVEVACHLTRAGRDIGYLGLVDGLLNSDTRRSLRGLLDLLTAPKGGLIVSRNLVRIVKRRFFERHQEHRAGRTAKPDDAVDDRFTALGRWEPQTCDARGLMLLSVFNFERSRSVWGKILPNCKQVKLRTDHHYVLSAHSIQYVASVMSADLNDYFEQGD